MDWMGWTLAGLGLIAAGVVKGATGIGYATCALPILTYTFGLKPAMALILAPTIATNMSVAMSSGDVKESARKFAPLYVGMIPGVGVGVTLLSWVDSSTAVFFLGVLMICYSVISLARPALKLSEATARWLKLPVGFLNGVLTGLTGSQVIPLVPYVLALELEPKQMIQAINLGVLILTTLLGAGLLAKNLVDPLLLEASILAAAPALVGVKIGTALRAHLPGHCVQRLVLAVVGLIGLKMVTG